MGPVSRARRYNAAITACEKGGQFLRAMSLLDEMKSLNVSMPDLISYNAAIAACEADAHWRQALALLDEMQDRGIVPDVISCSAAISACEKAAQWRPALTVLNVMRDRGVEPNVISYSAAISACGKAAQWKVALALLRDMRAEGLRPDVITYNAAISACAKGLVPGEALRLLDEMQEQMLRPNGITYSAAIAACEAAGDRETAKAVWAEAFERRVLDARSRATPGALDLHGFIAPVARVACACALDEWRAAWRAGKKRGRDATGPDGDDDIVIVTGPGRGGAEAARGDGRLSDGPVLRPETIVQMLAKEPKLRVVDAPDMGRVVIPAASLRAWAEATRLRESAAANALEGLTVAELRERCREAKLAKYSRLRKAELVELLRKQGGGALGVPSR